MNSVDIIGITGLFCSGKSTLEKIIEKEFGYFIIDLDKIGHIALIEKKYDIVRVFGEEILTSYGIIDRKKLGEIVFKNKKMLNKLNNIVWPFIINEVKERIKNMSQNKICINGAVLFEMGLDIFCSRIFIVRANIFNILKRAKDRNNYSFCKTFAIIRKQKVLKLAKKKEKNTEIIYVDNNLGIDNLKKIIKVKLER